MFVDANILNVFFLKAIVVKQGGLKVVETSHEIKEIASSTLASLAEGLEDKNCMIAGLVDFELDAFGDRKQIKADYGLKAEFEAYTGH